MSIKVPYSDLLMEMISIPAISRNEERAFRFPGGISEGYWA